MIVVADSSPLSHLIRIGHVEILSKLFGHVLIPTKVAAELAHSKAPDMVREFMAKPPDWLGVRQPDPLRFRPLPGLDPGEEAAINLAFQERADLLLIDDKHGREVAKSRDWSIPITGTLGVFGKGGREWAVRPTARFEKPLGNEVSPQQEAHQGCHGAR